MGTVAPRQTTGEGGAGAPRARNALSAAPGVRAPHSQKPPKSKSRHGPWGHRIKKWTLECSCVPKGVGATFCSKTGRFFVCGPTKPWGTHECSKESGPCSAAKQGRSLCVAPLKCLTSRPKPCPSGLGSKNEPSSARVCPKGSGPRSAAKQGRSLCVAPLNPSGPMSALTSRGHVLQQNRRFFVCGFTKPFGTHECSKESGPRSEHGRSLCVAPLKEQLWESMWPFSGGHILEKGPPRDRPRMCSKSFIL